MRRLVGLVLMLAFAAGCGVEGGSAYRAQGGDASVNTTSAPVDASSTSAQATTTEATTTTEPEPNGTDLVLEAAWKSGDEVRLTETIGKAVGVDEVPSDVTAAAEGCIQQDSRTMAVPVEVSVEVTSSLPASVTVDLNAQQDVGPQVVYDLSDGLTCSSEAGDRQWTDLEPGSSGSVSYWVFLRNAITPATPDGDPVVLGRDYPLPKVRVASRDPETRTVWGRRVSICGAASEPSVNLAGEMRTARPNPPGQVSGEQNCKLPASASAAWHS